MTDAPGKIWAFAPDIFDNMSVWQDLPSPAGDTTEYTRSDIVDALRAELARKDGAMTPKVKPLEWEGDGHWSHGPDEGWMEEANTPFGWGYSIEFDRSGNFKVDSAFDWSEDGFETPSEAKAAAQADYERRILAALKTENHDD